MHVLGLADDTLARWQFATTTIYHFLFVPISIGMVAVVAVMQTLAYRRARQRVGRDVGSCRTLLGADDARGVRHGDRHRHRPGVPVRHELVAYSRFVGDIFGAPLALEGLIAFFLESTFLGLWIFGRDLLSPKLHLACIWLAAAGSTISAYFILAANSWMQHPVGYSINPVTHRAELNDIWAVLTQKTQLVTFTHTIMAAALTAGALLVSVSAWHLRRGHDGLDRLHTKVVRLAIVIMLVAAVGVTLSGHIQGQVMTQQQPMKMAAAEALWNTTDHASFSLFAVRRREQRAQQVRHQGARRAVRPGHRTARAARSRGSTTSRRPIGPSTDPGSYVPIVGPGVLVLPTDDRVRRAGRR